MKKILAGLLAFVSFSTFASEQCNKLAQQELKAAKATQEFYFESYKEIEEVSRATIKGKSWDLLSSSDNNFTYGVFSTECSTDLIAVNALINEMKSVKESVKAEIALLELLKLKYY